MSLFGNIGIGEIGIIILIPVLLFGARKIPQLAHALGSSIAEFKRGRQEGNRQDDKSSPHKTGKEQAKGKESSDAKA